VGDVEPGEGEAGALLQPLEARALERRIVVGVEIVDPDHLLAALKQGEADVEADEAGATGHDDRHASTFSCCRGCAPHGHSPDGAPARTGFLAHCVRRRPWRGAHEERSTAPDDKTSAAPRSVPGNRIE